jgi:hypothetical protein
MSLQSVLLGIRFWTPQSTWANDPANSGVPFTQDQQVQILDALVDRRQTQQERSPTMTCTPS